MQHRIIISGGGTGGHIYPALSIAGALRKIEPEIEILFVGAEGKMEMEKVPAAGYRIIGLPVAGLQRRLTAANLSVPFKVLKSVCSSALTQWWESADMPVRPCSGGRRRKASPPSYRNRTPMRD